METPYIPKKLLKSSSQGRQTLFRVTYRTQINLIRIADNKANMILGINAMIITVLVGIISSRMILTAETLNGNIEFVIPVVLVILTSLITALFAIRSAKPRLMSNKKARTIAEEKKSLLFFGNVWSIPVQDYIHQMEELIESPQEMYQHMIIDIHNQSKVLHQKYELLRQAYLIFMLGFTVSILSFLILWLV